MKLKITKFVHSCLLVETPERVTLFDPGEFSTLDPAAVGRLDDIFITHVHEDHCDVARIKQLAEKFPAVRITGTPEIVAKLQAAGVKAGTEAPEGAELFESPHEYGAPLIPQPPQEIGVHYLDVLSHPGDSHSFNESKAVLALPMQAPWGSTVRAAQVAAELKPRFIIPIHDWHWNDQARTGMYGRFEGLFGGMGMTFIKTVDGEPFELEV